MSDSVYILAYDIGSTNSKSCIYRIDDHIELICSAMIEHLIYFGKNGEAEQKADEWWNAVGQGTRIVMEKSCLKPSQIKGIVFCAQMLGFVIVDENGCLLRNPMNYLDSRATDQIAKYLYNGIIRICGWNAFTLLKSIYYTGGMAVSAKDPLWKYHWVKENEPEIFKKIYKWLDVKDYFVLRCTGKFSTTHDSANLTFLYDTRQNNLGWNKRLCETFNVNMDHLPDVYSSTDCIGYLASKASQELGLEDNIPVFGGGGDASMITVGSGCFDLYDTHIYVGTSGWVISNVDKRMVDMDCMIASILGATPGRYNYIAEQETSGVCLQWVRDHLALDEIGIYLKTHHVTNKIDEYDKLYEYMDEAISETAPGSGNVIFTPWLHGNRAPKEDPFARGMFFNINLNTGKRQIIRSVVEGIAFHKRWMLESVEKKIPYQHKVRFVGGGAKSEVECQILADITGRNIETIENPQYVGSIGAAAVCAKGLGMFKDFKEAKNLIPVKKVYAPQEKNKKMYDTNFKIFKELYEKNKKLFYNLNKNG